MGCVHRGYVVLLFFTWVVFYHFMQSVGKPGFMEWGCQGRGFMAPLRACMACAVRFLNLLGNDHDDTKRAASSSTFEMSISLLWPSLIGNAPAELS